MIPLSNKENYLPEKENPQMFHSRQILKWLTNLKVIYTCMFSRDHVTNSNLQSVSLSRPTAALSTPPPAVQTASGSSLFVPVGCHSVCPPRANLSITIRTVRAWLTFRYLADTHTCSYVTPPPSESRLSSPKDSGWKALRSIRREPRANVLVAHVHVAELLFMVASRK